MYEWDRAVIFKSSKCILCKNIFSVRFMILLRSSWNPSKINRILQQWYITHCKCFAHSLNFECISHINVFICLCLHIWFLQSTLYEQRNKMNKHLLVSPWENDIKIQFCIFIESFKKKILLITGAKLIGLKFKILEMYGLFTSVSGPVFKTSLILLSFHFF